MEFNLDELLKSTDFTNEESRKTFKEAILQHITYVEGQAKEAYAKRDTVKKGFKVLEQKVIQLTTKKQDPTKAKMLEQQIIEHASKNKAINVQHVFRILKDEFKFSEDGTFIKEVVDKNGNIVERQSVQQVVKDFLDDDNNSHLVTSPVKSGSGHSYSPLFRENKKSRKADKFDEEEADRLGLSLPDYLEVKKLKESKLNEIKNYKKR